MILQLSLKWQQLKAYVALHLLKHKHVYNDDKNLFI
jgi:hypothetical protein